MSDELEREVKWMERGEDQHSDVNAEGKPLESGLRRRAADGAICPDVSVTSIRAEMSRSISRCRQTTAATMKPGLTVIRLFEAEI